MSSPHGSSQRGGRGARSGTGRASAPARLAASLVAASAAWLWGVVPALGQGTQVPLGDLQIAAERLPDVAAADRIPVDTDGWTVVPYVGPATGAAVSAAISGLPDDSVLRLPDGEYIGHLQVRRSRVVVRGNCADPSAVVWRNDGNPQNPLFAGPLCVGGANHGGLCWNGAGDCPGGVCDTSVAGSLCPASWLQLCGAEAGDHLIDLLAPAVDWTGGFERGSTQLAVTSSQGFAPGDVVWIRSGVVAGTNESVQTDDFTYMAEVVAAGGGTIEIDRGLPIDFNPADGPRVQRFSKILRDSGVECLTLAHRHPEDPDGLYQNLNLGVRYAWRSWLSNVDLGDTFNNHARLERSARTVLIGNRFGEQHKSLVGDGQTCGGPVAGNPCWNKQTLVLDESHDNSFVDNVVHASIGVELAHSSSRNWIAYNWFPQPALHPSGEPRRALFPHGNYGYANLLEGNVLWGVGEMDEVWGSQGPRYVWFRNVALGPGARLSNEVWGGSPNPFVVSRDASYLLNHAPVFGLPGGGAIDTRADGMHLERNVFTAELNTGHPTATGTVSLANHDAGLGPVAAAWAGLEFPDSLNRTLDGPPSFWCDRTGSVGGPVCDFEIEAGIGAYWTAECVLPAQARFDGLACFSALFSDGFESGDLTAWSATLPALE